MTQLWKWGWPTVLVVVMVSACGGNIRSKDSSAGSGASPGASTTAPVSLKEVFDKLEASGELPVLDRSDSIAGPDVNANGVRDDIDRHIDNKSDTQPQKNSLKLFSRVLNSAMTVDTTDQNALREVANNINISVGCLHKNYPPEKASSLLHEIRKFTVNTRSRFMAYMKFNSAMSGLVLKQAKDLNCD